jgi:ankyrin repeat protein
MNKQPDEIICVILKYLSNLDLTIYRRVNRLWKNLIETQVLYLDKQPSIETCIITEDYYHYRVYLKAHLNDYQQKLIGLVNNKFFKRYYSKSKNRIIQQWNLFTNYYKEQPNELLIHYSKIGKLKTVIYLLDYGANINCEYNWNIYGLSSTDTPLKTSIQNGQLKVAWYLLERGADIHAHDDEAFIISARDGYIDLVEYMLKNGIRINFSGPKAFKQAAINGHIDIVNLLLSWGKEVKCKYYPKCQSKHHDPMITCYCQNEMNLRFVINDTLSMSAENGHYEIVKILLEKGADVHTDDDYALRLSAQNNHIDTMKLLLEYGADPKKLGHHAQKEFKELIESVHKKSQ